MAVRFSSPDFALRVFLGLLLATLLPLVTQAAEELRSASEIRRLTPEQAAQKIPVRLRATVTFFDEALYSRFVQDETAGIYLRESTNTPALVPGQVVEVEGTTSAGEYAPLVEPRSVRIVGEAPLPAAKRKSFEELASGQQDSQLVEVDGIVRSIQPEEGTRYHRIEIATGGGRLSVYATASAFTNIQELVDSTVRVRGVCSTVFNHQRQLFAIRLMVPRPEDLVVETPAPKEPFAGPVQDIGSLLQFMPQGTYGHRVQLAGTVIYQQPDDGIYIQNDRYGLFVQTKQKTPLNLGDLIEVLGFPAQGEYTPLLQDAIFRKIGSGQAPQPEQITCDEALRGTHDCRLVRIEAKLLNRAQHSRDQFLVLESGDFIFHAYQERTSRADAFAELQDGSQVAVTGVCLIEPGKWQAGENWRAKSFHLLLRSPADVVVLRAPPWWTLKRLLWIMGALGVVVLGASVWVGVLRRRVQQQTEIIRQKLEVEAALKERYLDLFENANDMVYTHDHAGKITSINEAGERLLQRPRNDILNRNILDLLLPEQKPAAQHWLEQVLKDAAPPTAEWDFASPSGTPIKVEISTRLIKQKGQPAEVEGIARDITERKRLERELLEISNREQRRIGHDLHDGVCQQLVGISYLTESLADRLHEKSAEESSVAERIGYLLNNALMQTRGVARGLFPVRLEENGLVSALEELCANANQLFEVKCRFLCENAPECVENGIALHLYYIVQEAIANAAKHGKASHVQLKLERCNDRFALSVQDNGAGFDLKGARQTGMGLRIMHYRARVIGATLEVKSQPGHGTQVTCVFLPGVREMPATSNHHNEVVSK